MSRTRKPFKHTSGFVSIAGRPNAGKSTLLNALVGQKLAIVTNRPQTTRTTVQGVLTVPESQIVFVDTPGIHKSDTPLNKRMMEAVRSALQERDLILYVLDAGRPFSDEDRQSIDLIRKSGTRTFAVLNKVDKVDEKPRLLALIETLKQEFEFAEYFPISASKGDGVPALQQGIIRALPEGPALFPEDYLTDQPERFLVAELIREKLLKLTHAEVPHSIAVLIEKWEEEPPKLTRINATIYVERVGQKAIIIGSGGSVLKKTGTLARLEIEKMIDRRVYLELFVKVRENWRESPQFLNEIDWRLMAGPEVNLDAQTIVDPVPEPDASLSAPRGRQSKNRRPDTRRNPDEAIKRS